MQMQSKRPDWRDKICGKEKKQKCHRNERKHNETQNTIGLNAVSVAVRALHHTIYGDGRTKYGAVQVWTVL